MQDIIKEPTFWDENIINAVSIGIAICTFIIERFITSSREKNNTKYDWFLKIIVEPHLDKINPFYLKTDKELKEACEDLKTKYGVLDYGEYIVLERKYCDTFKDRRKDVFNDFVSMIGGFDTNISTEVDQIINNLDDVYVKAIDSVKKNTHSDSLLQEILVNKASLYQTLFKGISYKRKYSIFIYITIFILLTILAIRLFFLN